MQTVFVGLSGGVDSAVSAALLKGQGYNVVGAFIKIWQPEFTECTWKEDRLDAMRVCVALGIPFKEIDLSDEYKKNVVEEMITGYAKGITPNPDVLCNRHIKFGPLWKWAKENGADMLATGHYAQVGVQGDSKNLLRSRDLAKDQSYFLYQLNESDLTHVFFPVGHMTKLEVRAKAASLDLPVARKGDSQGLCFVGEVSIKDFLKRFISVESGPVVDMDGKVIGEHEGAALYTVGQRHGFSANSGTSGSQYFIVGIDVPKNTLQVSTSREDAAVKEITLNDVHWISKKPIFPLRARVQARYHESPVEAEISEKNSTVFVKFDSKHIAAPGQSLVMYVSNEGGVGEKCLGGGVINSPQS